MLCMMPNVAVYSRDSTVSMSSYYGGGHAAMTVVWWWSVRQYAGCVRPPSAHAPCESCVVVDDCRRRDDSPRPVPRPPPPPPVCRSRAALPEAITCDIRSAALTSPPPPPGVALSSSPRAPADVNNDAAVCVRLSSYSSLGGGGGVLSVSTTAHSVATMPNGFFVERRRIIFTALEP